MRQNSTPLLDEREAAAIVAEFLRRSPAYVPEWRGRPGGPGMALAQIFARAVQTLILHLNQAPDLNKLAFLDLLGFSLAPPRAARAPVVFQLNPNALDSRVPSGTRLAAPPAQGRSQMLTFETEEAIGLAAARLAEVVTLWPGRDRYADHSPQAAGGRSFRLFDPLQPVPHVLYLAHPILLGFSGKSAIELTFDLLTPSQERLDIVWEYWDEKVWRGFKPFQADIQQARLDDSVDGAEGLTRNGVIRLATDCANTTRRKVNGIDSFWVRGRLADNEALPPDPAAQLPVIDSIHLNTAIDRQLSLFTEISAQYAQPLDQQAPALRVLVRDEAGAPLIIRDAAGNYVLGALVTVLSDDPYARAPGKQVDALGVAEFTGIAPGDYEVEVIFDGVTARSPARMDAGADLVMNFTFKGLPPEKAFQDSLPLDPVKAFYPFGQNPQPGTAFYFTSEEVLSKPNAEVEVLVVRAPTPQDQSAITPPPPTPPPVVPTGLFTTLVNAASAPRGLAGVLDHPIAWEYWNGSRWVEITVSAEPDAPGFPAAADLDGTCIIRFTVPEDIARVKVNDQEALWMRVRLVSGGFGTYQTILWQDPAGNRNQYVQVLPRPPALSSFRLGYTYRSPRVKPAVTLTYNDFQYEDHTGDVLWPGLSFLPYRPVADLTPTLYLGFDRPLPLDRVSLFLDIAEAKGVVKGPPLDWEYWDGAAWRELFMADETANLRLPGMLSFIGPSLPARPPLIILQGSLDQILTTNAEEAARFQPGDLIIVQQANTSELATVKEVSGRLVTTQAPLANLYTGGSIRLADLARFGTPRAWVRGRMREDGPPVDSLVNGIYLNAAWAAQVQTVSNELLGGSTGQAHQVFPIRQTPVLEGEIIEVRELEGERAQVEFSILKEELLKQGLPESDLRQVRNSAGRLTEVWIRWHSRPHLFFSGSEDRHYVIDRARGLLIFGDGVNGKIPPAGANNLLARRYRFGGGQAGNLPAGAIAQLLGGVPAVQGVTNPRRAEGGADGEPVESAITRLPQNFRHRWRALSAKDYEDLARQASPGVSAARALPNTGPDGYPSPGWVTLIILPQSPEPQPQPSYELRRQVLQTLQARAPASVGAPGRIYVTGPEYLPIGVITTLVPQDPAEAGPVEGRARQALESFLHPATGGPDGLGWAFGRDVYLSDIAAVLEAVQGVDHVEELHLLAGEAILGERVPVPPLKLAAAGEIRIRILASEL